MTNPYAPPQAAVLDVADPNAGLVPADRGTRLGAMILDSIIFMAMVYVPFLVGFFAASVNGRNAAYGASLALMFAGLVAWCWVTVRSVRRNGQSIAKKLLSIKVVRSDGSPASLGRIFWLRNFVNGLISIIPFYGFIDPLFIFAESRQCLHDKIADTIVIKA
jgi:uncharacterized RDD family membrane protein YckC